MAKKIKINTNSLKSDADSIGNSIQSIKSSVSNLKNAMAALDSMWEGDAHTAFKAAYSGDIEALYKVIENFERLNGFEKNARQKYDSCEKRVGEIVAGIKW